MPNNIAEKFAEYEAGRLADREIIAELGQKIARLESENRSMREWSSDRFMSLWENTKGRDVNVVQALQNIHALVVEENGRQIRIRQTAENLEALIRMTHPNMPPLDTPAMPGSSTLPIASTSMHPITATSTHPQDPADVVLNADSPLSRHEESDHEESNPLAKKRERSVAPEPPAKRQKH
jgi:hypothetical protein